ncbi:hypothetical protein ACFY2W_16880 [Streptomyces sp. NPDC001262]|uniref:hypothetical protein n=1 Tax=Streptomyces sp. NPDC001262 TaxID=3364552 RepID=UPI0036A7DEFD
MPSPDAPVPPKPSLRRRPVPCAECRRIRAAYHEASRDGNHAAVQWCIEEMGRHHRAVH